MTIERPMFPPVDRRRMMTAGAALAALVAIPQMPAQGGTQVAPAATDDPIWDAMREHVAARKAWSEAVRVEFASEGIVPDEKNDRLQTETSIAADCFLECGRKLLTTMPTSLFGVIAVLRYVNQQVEDGDEAASSIYLSEEANGEFWSVAFLGTIASALITIHGT